MLLFLVTPASAKYSSDIIRIIQRGGVGVLPTDTLYGLVGSAFSKKAIQKIYRLKKRNVKKPLIVLIHSLRDLRLFSIAPPPKDKRILAQLWPGKVSVIFLCPAGKFRYLHRGTRSLAFRVPAKRNLRALLAKTGPLVAPSANPEKMPPATTIKKAQRYFGSSVDFYVDGGKLATSPSTLIALRNGQITLERQGSFEVPRRLLVQ